MRDFIRELYLSELSEASRAHFLTPKGCAAANRQDNIYKKLSGCLEKSDLDLFEEYINSGVIIRSEELFHAYVSGMKDFIRLLASVFDEQ